MKKFKNHIILLAALLFSLNVSAQLDRSVQPKPGPAPDIKLGDHQTFTLDNGLKVILVENHKLPRISYQLTVDVDPIMEGDAVGYVSMAGDLLRSGTKTRSKQDIDKAVDFIGANMFTYTNGIYALTLTKHKDELLELFADVLLNPTFPEEEIEKNKMQTISGLTSNETSPATLANRVGQKLNFPNHPYGEVQTKKTVENINRDLITKYYNAYYKPNVSYLIIVGDIKLKQAKKDAEKYFGSWAKAEVPSHKYELPKKNSGTKVAVVHKDDAVQSYISITYPVNLTTGTKDVIPAKLANDVLGSGAFSARLISNLREDKGYTYGAYSSLHSDPLVGEFEAHAQVGTEVTDDAVNQFLIEMNRMQNESVTADDLDLFKNIRTGIFARSTTDPQTIASYAFNTIRYNLPSDYYSNYLSTVSNVSAEDIQNMAKKYIVPEEATIVVVGDKTKIKDALKKYSANGEVAFYDIYGNPVEDTPTIPADVTAEKVLENYIKAIGGEENLTKIKTLKKKTVTSMNGMSIASIESTVNGEKFCSDMQMNGTSMQKQLFDGEKGYQAAMGQKQEILGEDLESFKEQTFLVKELKLKEFGYTVELAGMEDIEGKSVYKLSIAKGENKIYEFFDVESGLKVQTKSTLKTPQGDFPQILTYSDYKEIEGVKFPYTVSLSGIQNMEMKVESIEINAEIPNEVFVL